eukprot:TRINITY_DN469_c0_g1_i1.p1 TRINITY_DN469_c0_g1~~TRINITY_DN469_c0_g1_i1.p1  ORF type:complete len:128 (-),score=44.66 TRINITY_DN469_c0_g1_i1:172-555(-)
MEFQRQSSSSPIQINGSNESDQCSSNCSGSPQLCSSPTKGILVYPPQFEVEDPRMGSTRRSSCDRRVQWVESLPTWISPNHKPDREESGSPKIITNTYLNLNDAIEMAKRLGQGKYKNKKKQSKKRH